MWFRQRWIRAVDGLTGFSCARWCWICIEAAGANGGTSATGESDCDFIPRKLKRAIIFFPPHIKLESLLSTLQDPIEPSGLQFRSSFLV